MLPRGEKGFIYLSLLFIVAVMGIAASATGYVWSTVAARNKEEELLFRGGEIKKAVSSYYQESPGAKSYPRNLEDLLKDPRYPVIRRHLRKIYQDPVTGKADWENIKAPQGGIMGVKSRSEKEPFKKKNFAEEYAGFEGKSRYSEWEFIYVPLPAQPVGRN